MKTRKLLAGAACAMLIAAPAYARRIPPPSIVDHKIVGILVEGSDGNFSGTLRDGRCVYTVSGPNEFPSIYGPQPSQTPYFDATPSKACVAQAQGFTLFSKDAAIEASDVFVQGGPGYLVSSHGVYYATVESADVPATQINLPGPVIEDGTFTILVLPVADGGAQTIGIEMTGISVKP